MIINNSKFHKTSKIANIMKQRKYTSLIGRCAVHVKKPTQRKAYVDGWGTRICYIPDEAQDLLIPDA